MPTAHYHLPGLFEFYELYRLFLPLYREHREYFHDWCDIGSLYGAPADCLWGGGRVGFGDAEPREALALAHAYGISARLTFSNSLLRPEHLEDRRCHALCRQLQNGDGVIVASDLLLQELRERYPHLYLVSSTTKVLTEREALLRELDRPEFRYVVPDFRHNPDLSLWQSLTQPRRDKVELLCNECCAFDCRDRKRCYESVSRGSLGEPGPEHRCTAPHGGEGYRFSQAMENPGYIGPEAIRDRYLPLGISHFKLEGRGLGSAVVL